MAPTLHHRISQSSYRSTKSERLTGSTFGQSLFNSVAVLLGVGILSEPYAFAQAGWIMGSVLTIGYALLTCYTAKILGRIIFEDRKLRTYADCGRKAFGERSSILTQLLFCLELFTLCVVLVVLYSDSMQAVFPRFSSSTYKFMGMVILIPTAFLPLSVISYTSLLSIIATLFIVVVLAVDGLSKYDTPGSLLEFAQTSPWPASSQKLGLSFGLFMAGFSGHAVIPSIARDMRHPEEFDSMINYAFAITTAVYGTVGACGYLMFGNDVSDEISWDLHNTAGYNATLGQIGLWMLVIGPITKFPLSTRPLNIMFEMLLNIDPNSQLLRKRRLTEQRSSASLQESILAQASQREIPHNGLWRSIIASQFILLATERIALVLAIVGVAVVVPQFGTVMSILGAFCAFSLCVIGPLAAKLTIYRATGWSTARDWCLFVISVVMCVWGTVACVLNREEGL
ncbi:hypothetical protein BS47DRAFT_1297084 [Hydnum rufescens UP504]|uniref:Amino acid transporter transmembrane domain-containing protein n=1 Tax=Hydnum rufescens UP504 TaxID=1448309 RepID=A0A9P6AY18_9AGAM|nr:hypothetical protein BS47DRAFT_1297084 [Hydnum rufescens UP504]